MCLLECLLYAARLCTAFDFLIERVGFNLQFDKTLRNKTSAKRAQNRNDFFIKVGQGQNLSYITPNFELLLFKKTHSCNF